MRKSTGLTHADLIVAVACVFFVLANVPVIIAAGRGRAKIEVCMTNLKTLTSAWKAYADDNDGKLVNAAPQGSLSNPIYVCDDCTPVQYTKAVAPFSGGHIKELSWIGDGYLATTDCGYKCAMDTGALWKYMSDYSIYRCPTGHKNKLITYTIVDSMNGLPASGSGLAFADRGANISVWKNHLSQIRKSSSQLVFIDIGTVSPDSYAVNYNGANREKWFDPPMVRHDEGSTFSFADGHAEYKKWRAKETVDFARLAEQGSGFYNVFPNSQSPELAFQDLYWMQIHCWGNLGYAPTYPPDID